MTKCAICKKQIPSGQESAFPYETEKCCLACMKKKLAKLPENTVTLACGVELDPDDEPDIALLGGLGFEFMTYREGQKLQKEKAFPGQQLEHILPNSSHVSAPGRKSDPVPGAEGYSEADALIFPIGDDQSPGTEHKFITDYERAVDTLLHEKDEYATIEQKVKLMIPGWEQMILRFRGPVTPQEARDAAIELGKMYLDHSENELGIPRDTLLRNGFLGKKAEPPPDEPMDDQVFSGDM